MELWEFLKIYFISRENVQNIITKLKTYYFFPQVDYFNS